MRTPIRLLFLCTGNSCRSQMAEGWARALKADSIEAFSAGTAPHGVDPLAVRAMAEAGVDISAHQSKSLQKLMDLHRDAPFDFVITVCDNAREACPVFPGDAKIIHRGFADPPALAREIAAEGRAQGGDEAVLAPYREVRDEIRAYVETLPEGLD